MYYVCVIYSISFSASMYKGEIRKENVSRLSGHDTLHPSAPSLASKQTPRSCWERCCSCFHSPPREGSPQTMYLTTPPTSPSPPISLSAEADTITPPTSPTPTIRSEARAEISDFVEEPWYHGDISWTVAEERLKALSSECFLVRKSKSEEGKYILSVRYGGVTKHHRICVQNQRYEVEGTKKQFSTLQQLIAYYKQHRLSTEWERLVKPCSPPRLMPSKKGTPLIMSKH